MNGNERERHRWFDGELDRLRAGQTPDGLGPELSVARTLMDLHARQVAHPDEQFVKRLEASLMRTTDRPSSLGAATVRGGREGPRAISVPRISIRSRSFRQTREHPSRWPAVVELAVVAALLLALVTAAVGRDALFSADRSSNGVASTPYAVPGGLYRGDAARTGVQPGPGPEGEPGLLWRLEDQTLGAPYDGSPILADGLLYITRYNLGLERGAVVAIDASTGEERWQAPVSEINNSIGPAIANGLVYVAATGITPRGANADFMYAFDATTGVERWRYNAGKIESSSPAIVDGMLYLTAVDDVESYRVSLRAVDALTGKERWRFALEATDLASPQPGTTGPYAGLATSPVSPAVVDGIVYAASNDGVLFALDATTGTQRWRFVSDGNYLQTPAVADGQLILVAWIMTRDPDLDDSRGWVYALDAATGQERWVWTDGLAVRSPAIANGMVYLTDAADDSYRITALDAATGTVAWALADVRIGSAPVVAGTTIYATSSDGGLYAIDGTTGATLWRVDLGTNWTSDPVVADGRVIVAGDGKLFAIGGSEAGIGTPIATPSMDGDVSGRPACTVHPRQESEMTPSGTPSTDLVPARADWQGGTRQPILPSEIPAGQPAGQEAIEGILQTLQQIAACDRPGYGLQLAALVSDDFLRRGRIWPLAIDSGTGSLRGTVGAVDATGNPVTALTDVRVLPDGRVGVLRMWEYDPTEPTAGEFTVFVREGDRWLLDETRWVAPRIHMDG